jgi:hypothetical protein
LPALCVGTREDTLFVRSALKAGASGSGGIDVRHVPVAGLATEDLAGYACVFLCNALPLPGQDILRLEDYVRAGGVLTLFPGDGAAPGDYTAWECLPAVPDAVVRVPLAERKRTLRWENPHHALLRDLKMGTAVPSVSVRRRLHWERAGKGSEVLVSSGAEHPFLALRSFGRGSVLMFTVSGDRSWSDFPLCPYFLPILHQAVRYAAGVGGMEPYLWSAAGVALADVLPQAGAGSVLYDPEGNRAPVRSAVIDGRTVLHAEDLTRPGVYSLAAGAGQDPVSALAVNMPRRESDLTPADPEEVPALLGLDVVNVAESPSTLVQLIEKHRVGRTFGEALLWLALLVAAAEFVYANLLLRPPPKLTDMLKIDSGGRVMPGSDLQVDGS